MSWRTRSSLAWLRELRHRRLIVVFQPHRYSRLAALMHDFARAFERADRTFVLDVYGAGEENTYGVRASDLAHALRRDSVFADARGDVLRLGPAPYVGDDQLREAIATLSRLIT